MKRGIGIVLGVALFALPALAHAQVSIAPDACTVVAADCTTAVSITPHSTDFELQTDGTLEASCHGVLPPGSVLPQGHGATHCTNLTCSVTTDSGVVSGTGFEVITKKGRVNLVCEVPPVPAPTPTP